MAWRRHLLPFFSPSCLSQSGHTKLVLGDNLFLLFQNPSQLKMDFVEESGEKKCLSPQPKVLPTQFHLEGNGNRQHVANWGM